MVVLEGDVFCVRANARRFDQIDAPLIVLVDCAMYDRRFVAFRDYIVQFTEEINEWDDVP